MARKSTARPASPPVPPDGPPLPTRDPQPPGMGAFVPSPLSRDLSDLEFSLFTLMFGFQTWTETCMSAADVWGLKSIDILVLHAVNHRARGRRQAEICMVLNIEDTHVVAYALKKLVAAELVRVEVDGREHHYETTPKGESACLAYRQVREEFLVPNLSWVAGRDGILRETAGFLKTMSAVYSQAGRFATAATAAQPRSPRVRTKR